MSHAGRQLDDLIEQKIFGMDVLNARAKWGPNGPEEVEYYRGYPLGHGVARQFSTDPGFALILLDELRKTTNITIEAFDNVICVGTERHNTVTGIIDYIEGRAQTLPLALCLFALEQLT